MNLLIIDDEIETINGIMTGICWENLHFSEVYKATCVEEGMKIFKTKQIDIVLCDIEMPDGSGLDLLAWVRENYENTICIVLTCHEEFGYAKQAIGLQCKDYILKPVIYGELEHKLSEIEAEIRKEREENRYQDLGRTWLNQIARGDSENISYVSKKELADKIKEYIRSHIKDELRMDELAGMVYISQDYMSRIFKKMEGITITDFIIEERMFLAAELLKADKLPISRIAYECGYDNYSYFTKIFRKKFNVTPREFRQRYLDAGNPSYHHE